MTDLELSSLNALRSLPHIGDKSLRLLVDYFGSGQAAWEHTGSYERVTGLSTKAKASLSTRTLTQREELWALIKAHSINILHEDNPLYPVLLREIPDHPLLLYVRGTFDWNILNSSPTIAIVGSRKYTPYGEQVALRLSYDLAKAGFIIISGLAFGIDKKAHEGTLDAHGITLAVLGGGITDPDISPRSNLRTAERILAEGGALISEQPPHAEVMPVNFVLRNRIIAGLAQGVIVIEAAEKSGSLITANLALDYNREVFAVPGSIFAPSSMGTHALLKKGACLVTHARDILETLSPHLIAKDPLEETLPQDLSTKESGVLQKLSHEPKDMRVLIQETKLSISELQATLSLLELKGLAHNTPPLGYRKK